MYEVIQCTASKHSKTSDFHFVFCATRLTTESTSWAGLCCSSSIQSILSTAIILVKAISMDLLHCSYLKLIQKHRNGEQRTVSYRNAALSEGQIRTMEQSFHWEKPDFFIRNSVWDEVRWDTDMFVMFKSNWSIRGCWLVDVRVYTHSSFSQLTMLNANSSDLELSRISSASQLPLSDKWFSRVH